MGKDSDHNAPAKDASASLPVSDAAVIVPILGVEYIHLKTQQNGDLYVTPHGRTVIDQLQPENWREEEWFKSHRERLRGTSTVYRVETRPVRERSIDIVVKWNRVGQDVPLQTAVLEDVLNAEFNSPFEEFALVEELRRGAYGPSDLLIRTHRPLAIYVPPERLQLWQTGRSKAKVERKIHSHPNVELDILRQYIMLYEWLKGRDAVDTFNAVGRPTSQLPDLTWRVTQELASKGYSVADMKPAHIILRATDGNGVLERHGREAYGLVDFELLRRTPDHEDQICRTRRAAYHLYMRDRFKPRRPHPPLPRHLRRMKILGVNYVYGRVESTGGALWVVGSEGRLFDYFQPERWRKTPNTTLSTTHHVYHTLSKDSIHLVWKSSRLGEVPQPEEGEPPEVTREKRHYGYNCPFEEFTFALALGAQGIPVALPRAIYMTGASSDTMANGGDMRHYRKCRGLYTPDGAPVLQPGRDYIKIWGYWNGSDEMLAESDNGHFRPFNLVEARREGLLTEAKARELLDRMKTMLAEIHYEAIGLTGTHLLISQRPNGELVRGEDGQLCVRLCNFEFIREVRDTAPGGSAPV